MNKRVALNLGFFATIGLVLMYWGVNNVLQIDLVDKPYTITADFESSPGLHPGFDVGYLGTPIGRIRHVTLEDGGVSVVLAIDKGHQIPEGSTLAVRRKSAIGEPYVDIQPPPGVSTDGPFLQPGAHIPRSQTSTPLAYAELFSALDDLVQAVPRHDLDIVLHELAVGLDGRSEDLRRIVTNSADALHTFAENSELINEFTRNMADLVTTLSDHRAALGLGLDNAAVVTHTLSDANADLEQVLVDGDSISNRTADILARSEDDVSCVLGDLGELVVRLDRPDLFGAIQQLLHTGPEAAQTFTDPSNGGVIAHEPDGPYVRAIPPLNIGGENPVPVYDHPHQLPEVQRPAACPNDLTPTAATGASATASDSGSAGPHPGVTPAADTGARHETAQAPASSTQQHKRSIFNPFTIVWLLLALALLAAVRPWRWLPKLRRGG